MKLNVELLASGWRVAYTKELGGLSGTGADALCTMAEAMEKEAAGLRAMSRQVSGIGDEHLSPADKAKKSLEPALRWRRIAEKLIKEVREDQYPHVDFRASIEEEADGRYIIEQRREETERNMQRKTELDSIDKLTAAEQAELTAINKYLDKWLD